MSQVIHIPGVNVSFKTGVATVNEFAADRELFTVSYDRAVLSVNNTGVSHTRDPEVAFLVKIFSQDVSRISPGYPALKAAFLSCTKIPPSDALLLI
jgi:hypothetical protein